MTPTAAIAISATGLLAFVAAGAWIGLGLARKAVDDPADNDTYGDVPAAPRSFVDTTITDFAERGR